MRRLRENVDRFRPTLASRLKRGTSRERDIGVVIHRRCNPERGWGGISTANISQCRSQSPLRPAASGLWLWAASARLRLWAASSRLRSRLRPARSVLPQLRGRWTRVLPARPIPNIQRMPARLDCTGRLLQALSGLLAGLLFQLLANAATVASLVGPVSV